MHVHHLRRKKPLYVHNAWGFRKYLMLRLLFHAKLIFLQCMIWYLPSSACYKVTVGWHEFNYVIHDLNESVFPGLIVIYYPCNWNCQLYFVMKVSIQFFYSAWRFFIAVFLWILRNSLANFPWHCLVAWFSTSSRDDIFFTMVKWEFSFSQFSLVPELTFLQRLWRRVASF